jgi:hypothetical protein
MAHVQDVDSTCPVATAPLCRPMCFKSSKIAPSGPDAHPRLRPASRGLMGVVSLLWRHLATTHRPPLVRTPFVVPKTQSQVQRSLAGLQEEAEPGLRWHRTPLPAQEGRPDAPLPFARGRVCTAYRWYFKCKLWPSSALQRAERCARNGVAGRCLGMYQLACWKGIHVV